MAATMTALIYKTPNDQSSKHRYNYFMADGWHYLDGLAGIFGDASQLISELKANNLISVDNNNVEIFKANIGKIGNKKDSGVFSQADLLADIDAVNIYNKMSLEYDIENVINNYYKTTSSRYTQFKENMIYLKAFTMQYGVEGITQS